MSAVSTGCSRLPIAKTPGRLVRNAVIDKGAKGSRVHVQPGAAGEFVIGNPVAGQHQGVALDDAALSGVDVLDLDGLQRGLADDAVDPGAGGNVDAEQRRRAATLNTA